MKLFLGYLRQYLLSFVLFGLLIVIFTLVFLMYDIQAEAVLYASVLFAVCTAMILVLHFLHYCRRYRENEQLLSNIILITEQIPETGSPIEKQYLVMLAQLREALYETENRCQQERAESIDFYTTWVHQIKTPISVMWMLLQSEDTEEHRALTAELFRIEQYTEMVLCWFRLDSKSNDFVIRQLPLDEIIRTAVRRYAPQFIRKRIRLVYEGTDIVVLSDHKWLLFLLEQMLSNAVKYTDTGCVTIAVAEPAVLTITDTGIGIAPEDLPRIFEKGYTGYNGHADKKSTGLGLYLCRKAADKLGHTISVTSENGKGSTFTIDLSREKIEIE